MGVYILKCSSWLYDRDLLFEGMCEVLFLSILPTTRELRWRVLILCARQLMDALPPNLALARQGSSLEVCFKCSFNLNIFIGIFFQGVTYLLRELPLSGGEYVFGRSKIFIRYVHACRGVFRILIFTIGTSHACGARENFF